MTKPKTALTRAQMDTAQTHITKTRLFKYIEHFTTKN